MFHKKVNYDCVTEIERCMMNKFASTYRFHLLLSLNETNLGSIIKRVKLKHPNMPINLRLNLTIYNMIYIYIYFFFFWYLSKNILISYMT